MKEFLGRSNIIVMASHSAPLVKTICNKAALMEAGRVLAVGPVDEIFKQYDASVHRTPPSPTAGDPH
jgi:ABC-type polysaccharide/polyol phosphate transport system ATPase subunit